MSISQPNVFHRRKSLEWRLGLEVEENGTCPVLFVLCCCRGCRFLLASKLNQAVSKRGLEEILDVPGNVSFFG
jgi:hypothetical protein